MTEPKYSQIITIIGAGKIGRALAQLWLQAGHSICFGTRSPENLSSFIASMETRASAKPIAQAAAEGEIIFLAIPYSAVDEVIPSLQAVLADKIVIDATNPFALSQEGHIVSSLPSGLTAGSRMASLLPKSVVVRAFTHVMDELLVSRGTAQPGFWAIAIAGDDNSAKQVVGKLVSDAGFAPVDIGILAQSAALDPGGKLFPHMFTEADMRVKVKAI